MPLWYSSEQAEDKIHDDGKHNANYDAGYYGEEELEVPFCINMSPGSFPKKGIRCWKNNSKPRKAIKAPLRIRILHIP